MNLKNIDLCRRVDLSDYSTLGIGGLSDYFFRIHNPDDISEISKDFGPFFYVLGNGSNVLIKDTSIAKPVVYLGSEFNYCLQDYSFLEVKHGNYNSK